MKIDSEQSTYMIFQMSETISFHTLQGQEPLPDFDNERVVKSGRFIVRKLLELDSSTDFDAFSQVMYGIPEKELPGIEEQIKVSSYMLVIAFIRQTEKFIGQMTPAIFLSMCQEFTRRMVERIKSAQVMEEDEPTSH